MFLRNRSFGSRLPAPGSHDHPLVLLNTEAFLETLPAFLSPDQASQQRLPDLLEVLRAITTQVEL